MTTYRARVEETRVVEFEFDDSEIEGDDDEFIAAFEIAQTFDHNDWETDDVGMIIDVWEVS